MKKEYVLEMLDTWLTSRLSHQPSKPVYYIVDCQILYEILDNGNEEKIFLT